MHGYSIQNIPAEKINFFLFKNKKLRNFIHTTFISLIKPHQMDSKMLKSI